MPEDRDTFEEAPALIPDLYLAADVLRIFRFLVRPSTSWEEPENFLGILVGLSLGLGFAEGGSGFVHTMEVPSDVLEDSSDIIDTTAFDAFCVVVDGFWCDSYTCAVSVRVELVSEVLSFFVLSVVCVLEETFP